MPRAEDFRARSRSRSRTRSSSHHAARHRHPMSLWPQPSSVGTIRAWVTLAREIYYLRSTVAFIGLIIASIVNLPIQLSAASTNIINTITWMRHNTYQSAPPVDIATEGTQWLRHHRQPGAQLLWLCAEVPRYVWNIRHHQRNAIRNVTEAMTEYVTTFLCFAAANQQNPPDWNLLNTDYFDDSITFFINLGNTLDNQLRDAQQLFNAAPSRIVPAGEANLRYYIALHSRNM